MGQVPTNKEVGAIWPNDPDGNAWGDTKLGFPPPLKAAGYKITDPGRFPDLNDNFSSQISKFKAAGAQIVTGVPLPPDFTTFWTQALQQGFQPKIASIGKALLFPAAVEALGSHGVGMSTELWWSPWHPYKSSLTGQSAAALAAAYEKSTHQQWTQPIGFAHALFEVAAERAAPDEEHRRQGVDRRRDQGDEPEHDRRAYPVDRQAGAERRRRRSSPAPSGARARSTSTRW